MVKGDGFDGLGESFHHFPDTTWRNRRGDWRPVHDVLTAHSMALRAFLFGRFYESIAAFDHEIAALRPEHGGTMSPTRPSSRA